MPKESGSSDAGEMGRGTRCRQLGSFCLFPRVRASALLRSPPPPQVKADLCLGVRSSYLPCKEDREIGPVHLLLVGLVYLCLFPLLQ